MKRFDEFTRSELAALTNEQVEALIDLECAHECAPISVEEPRRVVVPEIPEPDVTYYDVNGILFTSYDEASRFVDYLGQQKSLCNTDYDLDDRGYGKYKYISDDRPDEFYVEPKKAYTRARYDELKDMLIRHANAVETNTKQHDEFKKLCEARSKISTNVRRAVAEARDEKAEISRRAAIYKKYIELADGNETVAARFYIQHFGGDTVPHDVIMEYLIMDAKEEEHESV